ncbi:helix-turn-helix domain-containing protein [Micrococcus luteus]|uniref:helix-turn-helix transcriptional regulator n=1 Tax=Micrococcus luteus TaxID=1270 RepID=UPI0011A88071|nr:helix-turn-helix domain-containing protein [Micrococcus luteus]MBU8649723.1 helix-turn-helix domain-containing protein [Micrococcus luteus]MCV7503689.1 helix-turn-helix domain-containing protein [Micrococcus luteus]MCV7665914.1 helix-turn-helix domain-containing protein [Micrococcus luteus]
MTVSVRTTKGVIVDVNTPAIARPLTHLTPQDLAARVGVPVATVYNWRTTGYGPRGFRVGKYLRYRLADVEAWEDAQVAAEDDR